MATFVLVHGAMVGGWCWKRLTPLLRADGHEAVAPTLTGLGERIHLANRDVDLETHVQDVVNLLRYEELRDVVLVGASYGGMVIPAVADRVPDRIAQLIYLDAFIPADGQAAVDVRPYVRDWLIGDDWRVPPVGAAQWRAIDPDLTESDVDWLVAMSNPHPRNTLTQPLSLTNESAAAPQACVVCVRGWVERAFPSDMLRTRGDSSWSYHELEAGHVAMVSSPHALADLLVNLARDGRSG
jgi:pimeloyl-ACP methyl ester carboxylesterase